MLEFKTIEELKSNPKLLELIKNYAYETKKGKIKVLLHTNLQFIEPTEYLITYPTALTILEYKVNEISNKPFYIKEHKEKYNLKEIDKLTKKKTTLDPDNDFKEYTVELLKKLDCEQTNEDIIFKNNLNFSYLFDSLNRKAQRELINRLISSIKITRDDNYNIEIKNIKFTEEFISKSTKDYIDYLNELLTCNNIGITYKEQIPKDNLKELEKDYTIMSLEKMENKEYSEEELNNYIDLMKEHFYVDGIINCPYVEGNNIVDTLILIPKTELINI